MVQEDLPTGQTVAARPVVVQFQTQKITQGIQFVIGQLRQQTTAHLAGTGIGALGRQRIP